MARQVDGAGEMPPLQAPWITLASAFPAILSSHGLRFAHDSPLEETGFELSVPRETIRVLAGLIVRLPPASSQLRTRPRFKRTRREVSLPRLHTAWPGPPRRAFGEFLREQLAPLGQIAMRRMFGKTKNGSEVTWFTPGRALHAYVSRHARGQAPVIG
jgi:hypothetical protein